MKLFLDTADNAEVARHFGTGLIDGVTTNPTGQEEAGDLSDKHAKRPRVLNAARLHSDIAHFNRQSSSSAAS